MESLTFINDMSLENHQNLKHLQNAGPTKTKKLCQNDKILINFFLN